MPSRSPSPAVAARRLAATMLWSSMLAAPYAQAQGAPGALDLAQQIYQADLATCNSGNLPAPLRDACVREAGARLDRARGGPPGESVVSTPDGRATVVMPEGAPTPPTSSEPVTTPDGRANVVPSR